jgi:hypothetical protein
VSTAPTRSPRRCAEVLRTLSLEDAARVITCLDPRFAALTLGALHHHLVEIAPSPTPDHDDNVQLLLQISAGLYDHVLRMSGPTAFAVFPYARPALLLVTSARARALTRGVAVAR